MKSLFIRHYTTWNPSAQLMHYLFCSGRFSFCSWRLPLHSPSAVLCTQTCTHNLQATLSTRRAKRQTLCWEFLHKLILFNLIWLCLKAFCGANFPLSIDTLLNTQLCHRRLFNSFSKVSNWCKTTVRSIDFEKSTVVFHWLCSFGLLSLGK